MKKYEMLERIEELRKWVKCSYTKDQLNKMRKEEVKEVFNYMWYQFSK